MVALVLAAALAAGPKPKVHTLPWCPADLATAEEACCTPERTLFLPGPRLKAHWSRRTRMMRAVKGRTGDPKYVPNCP